MSNEQKEALELAKQAESVVILVELDAAQQEALTELELTDKRDEIASASFAAALRGRVQQAADKAIKAKYLAMSKNKVAVADECEKEIQRMLKLKQRLS